MIACRKIRLQNIISCTVLILILMLGLCLSANAQEKINVYNKNEEVALSHGLFFLNEKKYIHIDDLQQLGLKVTEEEGNYIISSNDILGVERSLFIQIRNYEIKPELGGTDFIKPYPGDMEIIVPTPQPSEIIAPPIIYLSSTEAVTVDNVSWYVYYSSRSTEIIGTKPLYSLPIASGYLTNHVVNKEIDDLIKVDGEYYISSQFIGYTLSHGYSEENGRIDFSIADLKSIVTEATLNLASIAKSNHNVNVYTAYKTGEGETIDDFTILSNIKCTVPENEKSVKCLIETPTEKIDDKNIYFIVDFGERYFLAYDEFDFSSVGHITVYGEQKDLTLTVAVNLPEIAECDIPFTVYLPYNKLCSQQGIVKCGEQSGAAVFTGLPKRLYDEVYIEFDYYKYKNLHERKMLYSTGNIGDYTLSFTPEYSEEVACRVSLPNDFAADGNVEVKLRLSKYRVPGTTIIAGTDPLRNWEYTETIILNKDNPSKNVSLYNKSNSTMLTYHLTSDVDGLNKYGVLQNDGQIKSNYQSAKEFKAGLTVDMQLLKKKTITVNVYRPSSISTEKDIYASVELDDQSTASNLDKIIDYTETPLIPSGKWYSSFEFEIAEDKTYTLKIADITGDDHLFSECSYVENIASVAQSDKRRTITFENEDTINLHLLECNNIYGVITSKKSDLNFTVTASCKLPTGKFIYFKSTATDGKFSLKLPQSTFSSYTLSVQTSIGKNSYYISDGISTNTEEDATKLYYEQGNDKNIIIEYIVQNPTVPVELSFDENNSKLNYKNVSDYLVEADIFIAYSDSYGRLISVEILKNKSLKSGSNYVLSIKPSYYNKYNVKAFVWKKDELVPLANIASK